MNDAYAELAYLQRRYGGSSTMRPATSLSIGDLQAVLEEASTTGHTLKPEFGELGPGVAEAATLLARISALRMSLLQPQTAYQDLASQQLLANLRKWIEEALVRLDVTLDFKPVLGTLSIPQVDGGVVTVGPDAHGSPQYLATFDRGVFDVINRLAKIASRALQLDENTVKNTAPEETLQAFDDSLRRFISLFMAFLGQGRADAAPRYAPDPRYFLTEARICAAGEMFVVAHEYGHILEGHVGVDYDPADLISAHEREYRADLWGLSIVLASSVPFPMSYLGIDVYLSLLSVLEQARPGKYVDRWHPTASQRRSHLRSALRLAEEGESPATAVSDRPWHALLRTIPLYREDDSQCSLDATFQQASTVERMLEAAWSACKPIFGERGRDEGDEASAP